PGGMGGGVGGGGVEEAGAGLRVFELRIGESRSRWSLARLAIARALVAAGDEARSQFEQAVRVIGDARSFDRARVHLLYGEHLRRARRRAASRAQLHQALEIFDEIHAAPWAARARSELLATGETARKRDSSTVDQLTAQELQICRFVTEGLKNKEIAMRLFLSPRTIDAHLRQVFAKLGITSRIQLAQFPLAESSASAAAA